MAIVSFWSESKKETAQTLSLVAVATHMCVEHNYKTLIIDATLHDKSLNRCFWIEKEGEKDIKKILNKGKLDIASGTEGLLSAVASNKTSPEIIANYTKVVFKNRLDVLLGMKTSDFNEHEKSLMLYVDLLKAANKYYDLILIDLPKSSDRDSVKEILKLSDVVMYTMKQNLQQIQYFAEKKDEIIELTGKNLIPLIGAVDPNCKYNIPNVASVVRDKKMTGIAYNNVFLEAASEASVAKFFLNARLSKKTFDNNYQFITSVEKTAKRLMIKFEEIKYGKALTEMGM